MARLCDAHGRSVRGTPRAQDLLAAAEACDRAAAAKTPEEEVRSVMEVWQHKEAIQLVLLNRELGRVAASHRAQERLPLRCDGDDFGRVESRIPKKLFFHLLQQRNFGLDGLTSDEGVKDVLKAYPQCRVKTVSGKVMSGYGGRYDPVRSRRRVHFSHGTLKLAD